MPPSDKPLSIWKAESYAETYDPEDGRWEEESESLLVVATNQVDAMGYVQKWHDQARALHSEYGDGPSRNWTIRNFERVEDTDILIYLINRQPGFTYSAEADNECAVTLIARSR